MLLLTPFSLLLYTDILGFSLLMLYILHGYIWIFGDLFGELESFSEIPSNGLAFRKKLQEISCDDQFLGWNLKGIRAMVEGAAENLVAENLCNTSDFTEESLQKTEEKVLMLACIQYLSPRLDTQFIPFMKKLVHHIWPKGCEDWFEPFGIDNIYNRINLCDESRHLTSEQTQNLLSVKTSQDSSEKVSSDICRDDIDMLYSLIHDATSQLKLQPSDTFCTQVLNLYQLTQFHSMVLIIGPAGCGKSCCTETFVATKNNYGHLVSVNNVFLKSQNSEELFGYVEPETKLWTCGLLPTLLGKVFKEIQVKNLPFGDNSKYLKDIHLFNFDGMADEVQMETLQTLIDGNGTVLLPNSDEIFLTKEFLFFWELENMATLSPALLTQVGILLMTSEDISWTAYWHHWLKNQSGKSQPFWTELADIYLPKLIIATKCSKHTNEISNDTSRPFSNSQCFIKQGLPNKILTLCALLNALENAYDPIHYEDYNNVFCLAAVWSFSGTVIPQYHCTVDQWWRETFSDHLPFPQDETVFDYGLDVKNHSFEKWTALEVDSLIPTKSTTDFIYSKKTLQLLFLSNIVALGHHPVLLAGRSGSGKTRIIKELLKTGDSIESSEIESLQIHANKLTTSQFLKDKLNSINGLKDKGICRKLCFIDDLNCVQTDHYGDQPCLELIRQHLDKGGHYKNKSYYWQKVTNITYIATVNSNYGANYPQVSDRLLRHFAIFSCGSPDSEELAMIFSRHINCLFPTENSTVNEEYPDTQANVANFYACLQNLGVCTIEIYTKLKSMFLPTSGRQHYIFSINGLKSLFSNLCLSISSASQFDDILHLWYYEFYWEFGHKMSTSVDFERYQETVKNSIGKYFNYGTHHEHLTITEGLVYSNLYESDNGKVGADKKYQIVNDYSTVHHLLSKTASDYNKTNQALHLPLYNVNLELICRVSRILSCYTAKCREHMIVVIEGLSGSFYGVLYLSAFLSDWTPIHLQKCSTNMDCLRQSLFMRNQLISICQQAGLKNKKIFLLVKDKDICNEEILELLLEYIVNGNLDYLFSQEQQDNIASSLKNDTNQLDLKDSSLTHMWNQFVRNVGRNLRICLVITNRCKDYQKWCCKFPALMKNTNFIWLSHWTRKQLVENAMYHVNELTWLSSKQRENICHLLASMHSSLHQLLVQIKSLDSCIYCNNASYQMFVQKFVDLAMKRYHLVSSDHSRCLLLHRQLTEVEQEVSSINQQREHLSTLTEQCQLNSRMLLQQIGQNGTIIKQQENFVCLQKKAIQELRKLLPEYQMAHQRAVFKTVQIVVDTKKLVESLNMEELGQLKVMPKPVQEIADIFAALIIIVKSSTSELTWYKGVKRLMANLERFIGELTAFDEYTVPLSHLEILQDYVKKESFNPDYIDKISAGNSSCRILCQWVINVTNYNTTMMKKVKPLHEKVKETVIFIAEAEKQLNTFKDKLKILHTRKAKLTHNFQEASLSVQKHEISLQNLDKFILNSPKVLSILKDEKNKLENAINIFDHRVEGIIGITAMAAGLTSHLGPFHHRLRQLILTLVWQNLLINRGIHLFYDKIDHYKGYTIEWSVESEKSEIFNERNQMKLEHEIPVDTIPYTILEEEEEEELEDNDQDEKFGDANMNSKRTEEETLTSLSEPDIPTEESIPSEVFGNKMVDTHQQLQHPQQQSQQQADDMKNKQKQEFERLENGNAMDMESFPTLKEQSILVDDLKPWPTSCSQTDYQPYLYSLIKVLAGEQQLSEWLKMDLNVQNLENAAILWSCQNSHLFLVDPHCFGQQQFEWQTKQKDKTNIDKLDLNQTWDDDLSERFLRNMEIGKSTLLYNYSDQLQLNDTIECFVSHQNMADSDFVLKGKFLDAGCFTLSSKFRLCITSTSADICLPLDSGLLFTIVNYGSCRNMLTEDLKNHMFRVLYPGLYKDYNLAVENLQTLKCSSVTHYNFISTISRLTPKLSSGYFQKWLQWNHYKDQEIKAHNSLVSVIEELERKKCDVEEIAHQAGLVYSLMYSLKFIKNHYSFHLFWFRSILDQLLIDTNFVDKDEKELLSPESYEHNEKSPDEKATDPIPALNETEFMQEYQFPNLPNIPTPKVYHRNLSMNETKKIIQSLMNIFINLMQMCLNEEDWLLFKLLLSLTMEMVNANSDTWQQLALIIQGCQGVGIQLTLEDFQSTGKPPDWLPASIWENVMTLSVLRGPMDNFCVRLITNQEVWADWYHSECPEMKPLPINLCEEDYESGNSEEFLRLLLIRNLRPDRFLKATEIYLERCVSYTAAKLEFEDVLQASLPFKAILLSCPGSYIQRTDYQFGQMVPVEDKLLQLAAETGVAVKKLNIRTLVYGDIQELFENLVPHWLIIDIRNDCSKDCLQNLTCCLDEIPLQQSLQKENILKSSFVWIIQKESQIFPSTLDKYLFRLCWTNLFRFGGDCVTDQRLYGQHQPSSPNCIDSVVCCILTQINNYLKHEASRINPMIKTILFGTIVAHASLLASQALGSCGLDYWYPFDNRLLEEALQIILQYINKEDSKTALLESLQIIPELYLLSVVKESDRRYIKALINDVLHQVVHRPMSDIRVAGYTIPVAPANVELCNYVRWFQNRLKESNPSESIQNPLCISKNIDTFRNDIFFHKMNVLYDKQEMEELCGTGICQDLTSPKLWSNLELCAEKLPSCLDLADIYSDPQVRTGSSDSPNHDIQNNSNVLWILWQECLIHNTLLLKVHADVKYIKENFLEISYKTPSLQGTIECLKQHQVPKPWLYSNWRSSPHDLTTWLEDLNRQHRQLRIFLDKFSAAKISDWNIKSMPVWLGGMANPETFLTAVKTDFCFLHKYSLDMVALSIDVVEVVEEGNWSLVLTDLFLFGADWDYKGHCLQVRSFQEHHIPLAVLNVKPKTELNISSDGYDMVIYSCPIYMNTNRRVYVGSSNFVCRPPPEQWTLLRIALTLNPGELNRHLLKLRPRCSTESLILSLQRLLDGNNPVDQNQNLPQDYPKQSPNIGPISPGRDLIDDKGQLMEKRAAPDNNDDNTRKDLEISKCLIDKQIDPEFSAASVYDGGSEDNSNVVGANGDGGSCDDSNSRGSRYIDGDGVGDNVRSGGDEDNGDDDDYVVDGNRIVDTDNGVGVDVSAGINYVHNDDHDDDMSSKRDVDTDGGSNKASELLQSQSEPFNNYFPLQAEEVVVGSLEDDSEALNDESVDGRHEVKGFTVEESQVDGSHVDKPEVDGSQMDGSQVDGPQVDRSQVDGSQVDRPEVDGSKVDGSQIDGSQIDGSEVDGSQVDGSQVDWSEVDGSEVDGSQVDGSQVDGSEVDGSEVDRSEVDGSELDGPEVDGPEVDGSEVDGSEVDGSEVDGSQMDGSQVDGSEVDGSQMDGSEVDESEVDGSEVDGSQMDGSEVDESEVDGSEVDGSQMDGSEVDESEVDGSEVDKSEVDGSEVDESEVDGSVVGASEVDGSEVDGSEVDGLEMDRPEVDGSQVDGSQVDGSEVDGSEVGASEVDGSEVDRSQINGSQVDGSQVDGSQVDGSQVDRSQVDESQVDGSQVDGSQVRGSQINVLEVDRSQMDGSQVDGSLVDGLQVDGSQMDGSIGDGSQVDGPQVDGPQVSGLQMDGSQVDGSKVDGSQVDGSQVDGPQMDGSQVDGSQVDVSQVYGLQVDRSQMDGSQVYGSQNYGSQVVRSQIDGLQIDGSHVDGSQVDGSQVDGSHVDGSQVDRPQIDESQVDRSQVNRSQVDGSQVGTSQVDWSEVDESNINGSQVDGSKIDGSEAYELQMDESQINESRVDKSQVDQS